MFRQRYRISAQSLVRSFLTEGATVITSSRADEKLEALRGYLGELATDKFIPISGELGAFEKTMPNRNGSQEMKSVTTLLGWLVTRHIW